MQFLWLLVSFTCTLLTRTAASSHPEVLPPPQFEPLFIATLDILSIRNLTGPLGTRVHSTSSMFVFAVPVLMTGLLTCM